MQQLYNKSQILPLWASSCSWTSSAGPDPHEVTAAMTSSAWAQSQEANQGHGNLRTTDVMDACVCVFEDHLIIWWCWPPGDHSQDASEVTSDNKLNFILLAASTINLFQIHLCIFMFPYGWVHCPALYLLNKIQHFFLNNFGVLIP